MEFGGGVDIPINRTVSFRPAEFNYRRGTHFTYPLSGTTYQHNFRYSVGHTFNFGHTTR